MTDHPITPPPELIQQWLGEFFGCTVNGELSDSERYLAAQAARWGADQELDACCALIQRDYPNIGANALRAARRPKQPSLKAQALAALSRADKDALINPLTGEVVALRTILRKWQADTIRRALEALDG